MSDRKDTTTISIGVGPAIVLAVLAAFAVLCVIALCAIGLVVLVAGRRPE